MVTYLGSLVQSCCGEGGTLQTNITGVCGERSQCLGHTGFAPAHDMCAFPVYVFQALGCSAGELSKVGPGLRVLPRSKSSSSGSWVLPKGTDVVGLVFFPFQIPSSPGDQVLGESTLTRCVMCLINFFIPAAQFPGCAAGDSSQVCHVSLLGS